MAENNNTESKPFTPDPEEWFWDEREQEWGTGECIENPNPCPRSVKEFDYDFRVYATPDPDGCMGWVCAWACYYTDPLTREYVDPGDGGEEWFPTLEEACKDKEETWKYIQENDGGDFGPPDCGPGCPFYMKRKSCNYYAEEEEEEEEDRWELTEDCAQVVRGWGELVLSDPWIVEKVSAYTVEDDLRVAEELGLGGGATSYRRVFRVEEGVVKCHPDTPHGFMDFEDRPVTKEEILDRIEQWFYNGH